AMLFLILVANPQISTCGEPAFDELAAAIRGLLQESPDNYRVLDAAGAGTSASAGVQVQDTSASAGTRVLATESSTSHRTGVSFQAEALLNQSQADVAYLQKLSA